MTSATSPRLRLMTSEDGSSSDALLSALRPTSWAVLGILSFGEELSGYDVKKWANWSLKFFYWAPSVSQVYSELRKLEEAGLASSRVQSLDDVRSKRLYAITDAGQAALAQWAQEAPVEMPVLKHGVMLRMWLGHTTDPEHLRAMLTEHRDRSEKLRIMAAADAEGSAHEPGWAYPELVLQWSERYYADERDRADAMIADLDRVSKAAKKPGRKRRTATSD